ncbi:MAG: 6-phosphofructokinase [Crocinitomicaceae bacterium]|nr:6-phosphofructokinase [Crocinitomicaceae bacterium]MBK8925955.1 6-phosphofructokinase [Crocinitomicaceae bacterium]
MIKVQNIAVLTSGGDAPGMNACIRAVVRSCVYHKVNVFGVLDGFNGLIHDQFVEMNYDSVSNILQRGGTILGTARCKEFHQSEMRKIAFENMRKRNIDGLVIIGGDGSFSGASVFSTEFDIKVIGIPGTIDNDINGTDYAIGFDTAMNTIIHAVDNIRDTASSHHRVFLVEVMGNNSGVLALNTAVSSGAEEVFMPEKKEDLEEIREKINRAVNANKSSIIIVSEGDQVGGAKEVFQYLQQFGLADKLRVSILGHIQRGGSPTYLDRLYATLFGEEAVAALLQGRSDLLVGLRNGEVMLDNLAVTRMPYQIKNMHYLKLIRKLSVY